MTVRRLLLFYIFRPGYHSSCFGSSFISSGSRPLRIAGSGQGGQLVCRCGFHGRRRRTFGKCRSWGAHKIVHAGSKSRPVTLNLRFTASAGKAYRIWIRGKALNNSPYNDSIFVQFSGSVNSSGSAVYRIGTTSATEINLEDCHGLRSSRLGLAGQRLGHRRARTTDIFSVHRHPNTAHPDSRRWFVDRPDRPFAFNLPFQFARSCQE